MTFTDSLRPYCRIVTRVKKVKVRTLSVSSKATSIVDIQSLLRKENFQQTNEEKAC